MRRKNCKENLVALTLKMVVFISLILMLSGNVSAQDDRSFYFPSVIIKAEIYEDGSMQVIENRTFYFDGRYSGAWMYIDKKGSSNITDIKVSEGDHLYREMPAGTVNLNEIYFTEEDPEQVYIDWSFEAAYEARTFTISYLVENAVIVHQDLAELYWQFIGDQWGEKTEYAEITLRLPKGAGADELRAWGHGPLSGSVKIVDPRTVIWLVEGLPSETFVEGRVAFPLSLVPNASNYSGREGLPGMLADEEKWAREANFKRTLSRVDFIFGPVVLLLGIVAYLITLFRSKKHPEAYKGEYYRELPGEYSPAEAGFLVRKGRSAPEDITATILDLARRGHLVLEEYESEKGRVFKRSFVDYRIMPKEGKDSLAQHERKLYSFIFEKVSGGDPSGTTFKAIESFGKKNRQQTAAFYQD